MHARQFNKSRKVNARNRQLLCAAAIIATPLLLAVQASAATVYTWGSATTGGNWSSPSTNWSPTGVPATGDTAILDDATVTRTVVYDTGASGALGTLTINQSSASVNMLDMQRGLTVTNNITLGASGGGTSQIFLDPPSPTGSAVTFKLTVPQMTLNAGGVLELSNYKLNTGSFQVTSQLIGNLVVSGGTFSSDQGIWSAATGAANAATISGSVTMSSGSISFGTNAPNGNEAALLAGGGYTKTTDDRLNITGNLTITGGTFQGGFSTDGLYLSGLTNSISGLTNSSFTPQVVLFLSAAGTQSLQSDSNLGGGLYMRYNATSGAGTYQVGSKSGGTLAIAQISWTNRSVGGTETLQLVSDISSNFIPNNGGGSNANAFFAIDTNGHTFDLSGTSSQFSLLEVGTATTWQLVNSAGSGSPGTIKASSFDLSKPKAGASVGSYVNLTATGSGGTTNTLSNTFGGTIDPASTFTYSGTGSLATPATLTSNRTIGNLGVTSGVLQLTSAITAGTNSTVSIASNSTLDLNGNALTTPNLSVLGTGVATSGGAIQGTGGSSISVTSTLSGTGTFSAAGGTTVTGTGSVAPGVSGVGTLTTTTGLALASGSNLNFDLANDTTPGGTTNDLLSVSGTLSLAGGVLNINATDGNLADGTYKLITGFSSLSDTGSGGLGDGWTINNNNASGAHSYAFSTATPGEFDLIVSSSAVPEPASLGLLGLGALMGLLARKRRK